MRAAVLLFWVVLSGAAPPRQSTFEAAAAAFERAWRSGDADAIAGMLSADGIRLQLGSESHSQVAGRQARAAIAAFRGDREGGRVEMQQANAGRDPTKGSAQFRWETAVRGTSEQVPYTIFVELTRVGSVWRISAIRVS